MICATRQSRDVMSEGKIEFHHLITTPNKDGHRSRVRTFLNDQHLFPRRTKGHLPDESRLAQFLRRQVLKSRNNSSVRGR